MKSKIKKAFSLVAAAAMTTVSVASVMSVYAENDTSAKITQFPYTIEGEDLEGATLWTSIYNDEIPGYSGEGFTYLTGGALSFNVTVPEDGMYQISAKVAQILDKEGNGRLETIAVNGSEYSKNVPYLNEWTDFDFGVVRLKAGENTIEFLNKYGYLAIDTVTVSVAEKKDYSLATDELCDPDA
ncbi:MAG: beta-mannosidase, partial [Ruminococcus sp.]|nr:beta-mannosidase [Ruminococcus sp.]